MIAASEKADQILSCINIACYYHYNYQDAVDFGFDKEMNLF